MSRLLFFVLIYLNAGLSLYRVCLQCSIAPSSTSAPRHSTTDGNYMERFHEGFIVKVSTGSRDSRHEALDHRSSFPGFRESRLPHPTSSALSISMYDSQRKKGAKIIQSNTAKRRPASPRPVHRSRRGLSAVQINVSPLDQ